MNRSPFFYVGDKYKLMAQLREHFPKHITRLIEPFCGGGSVFLNTEAGSFLSNDINSHMIKLHEFLQSYKNNAAMFFDIFEKKIIEYNLSASYLGNTVPDNLKKEFKKTYYAKYNKNGYNRLKLDFNENKNDMVSLYVLLIYGFNHMLRFNQKGEFNLPVGNVDYNKNVKNSLVAYFNFSEENNIKFYNLDYKDFLKKIDYLGGDFVYLDPPYLISACEYNKGWNLENEINLLTLLDELNSKGIKFALSNVLSHKGNTNYTLQEWSKKYIVEDVQSNYISYHDNSIKNTREVLIKNYE